MLWSDDDRVCMFCILVTITPPWRWPEYWPQQDGENTLNKIHHKYWSAFVCYLYISEELIAFTLYQALSRGMDKDGCNKQGIGALHSKIQQKLKCIQHNSLHGCIQEHFHLLLIITESNNHANNCGGVTNVLWQVFTPLRAYTLHHFFISGRPTQNSYRNF